MGKRVYEDCSILKNLSDDLCAPDLNRTRRSGAKALLSNTMKYACMRLSHQCVLQSCALHTHVCRPGAACVLL